MKDQSAGLFFAGLLMGVALGVLLLGFTSDKINKAIELRDECEQNLPRSQVCVMQYVPDK